MENKKNGFVVVVKAIGKVVFKYLAIGAGITMAYDALTGKDD